MQSCIMAVTVTGVQMHAEKHALPVFFLRMQNPDGKPLLWGAFLGFAGAETVHMYTMVLC